MSDTPVTDTTAGIPDNAPAECVTLTKEQIDLIRQFAPDLSMEDMADISPDELQIFEDLGVMMTELRAMTMEMQESAANGGPSSIMGFIREFMRYTGTGRGELAAKIGISRLRMVSLLEETVDATPGEVNMMRDYLVPLYEKKKARLERLSNSTRMKQKLEKRALKKAKKQKRYDPITGMVIS